MEVILKKDVEGLAKAGAVVKVKDGFARNFLIPNGLALPMNSANLKQMEADKQQKSLAQEKARQEAETLMDKWIENKVIEILEKEPAKYIK